MFGVHETKMTTAPVLFLTSGDLIADRRYLWAMDHLTLGDLAGAAEVLLQAIEIAPEFATAWFALGTIRDKQGDWSAAIAAFQKARDADKDDYHGARLQLARLGADETTPDMTATYVRRLFDQHAPRFDDSLLNRLAYSAPQKLLAAVTAAAGGKLRLGSMLDLGCGTGLGGAAFRPLVDWLVGVDLSPAMIARAAAKGLYDRLVTAELKEALDDEIAARANYHLVLAADVFVYVNDLGPIVNAIAQVVAPEGVVAFTVETHSGAGVKLLPTLRYAHGESYIRGVLAGAGLASAHLAPASIRSERGIPIDSLVVVARTSTVTRRPASSLS